MTAQRWITVVLLMAAVLFFWRLGGHDLWAPDEPYFAEGAREMVVDGQWAVPHVNGKVTTDKPPLFFWLIAVFSLPLGTVTSFTARLPSALAALGTMALTMRLGSRFYGPKTAALAGFVLATTYMFWEKARWSQTDSLLCSLIWVALSAFEAWRAGDTDGLKAGLLFWLAAALAVLDKGPVGMLLPLGVALSTLAFDRRMRLWRSFAPVAGPALFLTTLGLWMVLATVGGGGEYSVWGALKEHFVDRGLHGLHHKQPFWYFAEALPSALLPWTALIPGALVLAWRRRRCSPDRFLLVVVVFVLVFFSLSTEKRELYALPTMPAFALLVATLAAKVCGFNEVQGDPVHGPARRWVTLAQGILGGLLLLLAIALPLAAERQEEVEVPAQTAWLLSALLGVTALATLTEAGRGKAFAAALTPGIGIGVAYLLAATVIYPAMEPRKSARPLAETLVEMAAASRARGAPVLAYEIGNVPEALAFYTEGLYTVETNDPQELTRHLERPEAVWALADGDRLEALPEGLRRRLVVVEQTRLARRPILLLTNQEHSRGTPLMP